MIGKTISHYKITEKLGEGGMGVVYKARDTNLDRDVALKFLPESMTPTEEDRQRFIREAKSAATLNHPNICTIYSVDEYEGRQFISMEYIEGETFREKIDRDDLTKKEALDYASRIADALGKAHQEDIIHRDIKPENIMIDEDGRIKVMDFGLAKLKQARDITKTGDTVGTLAYMSPEQIRGQQVDHRSDLFSLGIVLYEMLTGAKPFQGEHQAAMTYSIVNEEPTSLETYLPDATEELERFFGKALTKNPQERFSSAREVIEELEELNETIEVPNVNASSSDQSSNRKTNGSSPTDSNALPGLGLGMNAIGRSGLLGGVALLLVLVIMVGWWLMGDEPSPTESRTTITDRSIAVLPFEPLSSGEESKTFARGVHDDLLTRLSNIGDLHVISRTSVDRYRDTDLPLPVIADSLGVRWIVEGGVLESGGKVQVNAQLINPETAAHIWADSYQRELTAENLFEVQGEITKEITGALQVELSNGEQQRIAGVPTGDLEAYRLYIQGRGFLNQRTERGLRRATTYFERALEKDSTYAAAWAALAQARIQFGGYGNAPVDSLLPLASQAAERALQLAPTLAEAHASAGLIHMYRKQGPAALRRLQRALELDPGLAQGHRYLGVLLDILGRPDVLHHLRRAVKLNPLTPEAHADLAGSLLARGHFEEALRQARRGKKVEPEYRLSYQMEVMSLYHLGRVEEALKVHRQAQPIRWDQSWHDGVSALLHLAAGDTARAHTVLEQLKLGDGHFEAAWIHAALGETEAAFRALEENREWNWGAPIFLRHRKPEPLGRLQDEPRYREVIRDANRAWGLNSDGSIPEDNEISDDENKNTN